MKYILRLREGVQPSEASGCGSLCRMEGSEPWDEKKESKFTETSW